MPKNQKKHVAIYLRTSTSDKQDTSMQRAMLCEHAQKALNLLPHQYKIYEDHGYTGRTTNRPALKKLMSEARANKISDVLVYKFDRFARSLIELISMIKELGELKIGFISIKDNVDLTTAQGRFMLHMLGAFAEFESDIIRARVADGLAHAKKHGTRSGKPPGKPRKRNDAAILNLRKQGLTYRDIASRLKISTSMVQRSLSEVI